MSKIVFWNGGAGKILPTGFSQFTFSWSPINPSGPCGCCNGWNRWDQVVHPVKRHAGKWISPPGRPNDRGDGIGLFVDGVFLECPEIIHIGNIKVLDDKFVVVFSMDMSYYFFPVTALSAGGK